MEKIKAPDALIATSFLATMSIACQGLVDVKLPFGAVVPVSLNILIKAESGERKTATDKIVGEPIYAHDEASIDLPPANRASRSLVKFVFGEEDEHEEALYGTANHRVSEGSRGRYAGQGTVQEARVQ
ncbi:DUF3987 domain-containing protein [Burkholderia cenocepacia]|uniref:DUF3987 domain-containing protein n=1 Tax=Burkholderia cenocepacia TaxID=95486 RepID=UPI002119A9FA|nr:DUF3987 domain-containing protein [Burkholderia cenocepacia]